VSSLLSLLVGRLVITGDEELVGTTFGSASLTSLTDSGANLGNREFSLVR